MAGCTKNDLQLKVQDSSLNQDASLNLKSASLGKKFIVVLHEDANLTTADFDSRNVKVKAKAYGLLKKHDVSGDVEEVYETAL